MDRLNSILVAASPGCLEVSTLRSAVELADGSGARLMVLDVVPPVPRLRRRIEVEGRVIDIEDALVSDREVRLQHMVEAVQRGSEIDVKVVVGEPVVEVIRYVLEHENDLVIVGGKQVQKWETPEFGRGVMHLLRNCPVPVWVMRPLQSETFRVLALVDPDQEDPVRDSLNDLVLEFATSLVLREGGELHVGHAWEMEGEAAFRSSSWVGLPAEMVDVMVESVEASHREQLDMVMHRHRVPDVGATVHMVAGDAGAVLPRLAEGLEIGLIVMGTVARTGLSGWIMGNTAESILRSVSCSVLAVKPAGFVTPVKPA